MLRGVLNYPLSIIHYPFSMQLLIYTPKITNRLRYTFELVFNELLGVDFKLISNFEEFGTIDQPKINYGDKQLKKVPYIKAVDLLFERNIKEQKIEVDAKGEVPLLFLTQDEHSDLKFDPFAAIFYMVSRYEEYLPFKGDRFGRFSAENSIAFKYNFLEKPVVNLWVHQLKNILTAYYPALEFENPKCQIIPTVDVDIAYAYKNKGFLRNTGSYINELSRLNFSRLRERTAVLSGIVADPFDTFDYIRNQFKKYKQKAYYFFLVGDYGMHDKNTSLEQIEFRSLIKNIADLYHVGLHPSFGSNRDKAIVEKEQIRLENVIRRRISKSRQHYILIKLPDTYENLIDLEIEEDHSMGYADHVGFRAGICNPFNFYNLKWDIKTILKIVPFVMMDVTLKNYQSLEIETAIQKSKELINTIKNNQGTCTFIWHNNSLSEREGWAGWRKVFEAQLRLIQS